MDSFARGFLLGAMLIVIGLGIYSIGVAFGSLILLVINIWG